MRAPSNTGILIERAVEVWNETVNLPVENPLIERSTEPLIEIVETQPRIYSLPDNLWETVMEADRDNVYDYHDGESVIYFKPALEKGAYGGLAGIRVGDDEMIEADIYINTIDEQEHAGYALVLTKKLVDVDASYAAYAFYNRTYQVILHELGHAVGLGHIPVNGNVMSKNFGGGGIDQWVATLAFDLFRDFSPRNHPFVDRKSQVHPYMSVPRYREDLLQRTEFFTNNAKLGEQEKTALTCIYQY